jgi:lysophospholipase L1-like esterase
MKKLYILGLLACGFAACKPNIEPEKPQSGSADFTRYLAVGNSLTAGFADGTLYKDGQINSYPAMLAGQFEQVGGGNFKQPLLPGNDGYPTPKLMMAVRKGKCDAVNTLLPTLYPGAPDTVGSTVNIAFDGPYNNTGIPGIRCVDYIFPGYGAFNPYAKRFFANPGVNRPIDEVIKVNPTFFTCWVGSNDVLQYVTAGGASSGGAFSNPIVFEAAYDTVISQLTYRGAKGVAMNIPDVLATPYCTTIPENGLNLTKLQADDLNLYYANTGLRFVEGANHFVIKDGEKFRQSKTGEYILLSIPRDSLNCARWGSVTPIPERFVLTRSEADSVRLMTDNFNTIIKNIATTKGVAVVDMFNYIRTLQTGVTYNGSTYSGTYISGNAFSLDGLHLTQRGYALAANYIISTINTAYGSSIPMVDANKYKGILFP